MAFAFLKYTLNFIDETQIVKNTHALTSVDDLINKRKN